MSNTADKTISIPLCVDLDGTLVHTDTLVEEALMMIKQNPLLVLLMPLWLLRGKAWFKAEISRRVLTLDASSLPYNQPLLSWLQTQHLNGRPIYLVTAANHSIAAAVATHLAIFTDVIASTETLNLKGRHKRDALNLRFGKQGYDYAGNDSADLTVWADCRAAIVVHASRATLAKAQATANVATVIVREFNPLRELLRAMRTYQWSKNSLLFVHLVMAHRFMDGGLLASTALAFVAFCLCSSAVYLLNDLLDLGADRGHPDKRLRPFARGSASLLAGILLAPLLLIVALALAFQVSWPFLICLLVYFTLTLAYSLYLKRIAILDVLTLAMLYTLRIIAGASVAATMPSFWLMAFSLFIFTSLAVVKRFAELKTLPSNQVGNVAGRGYLVGDLEIISHIGVAAGYIATLVLALYIDSTDIRNMYRHSEFIWLLCPLLMYWIGRVWLLASRGELHQDPVVFATRDRTSYIVCLLGIAILWVAI